MGTEKSGTTKRPGASLLGWRRQRHLSRAALCERLNGRGAETSLSFLRDVERCDREPGRLEFVLAVEEVTGIPVESWANFRALTRYLEMRGAA